MSTEHKIQEAEELSGIIEHHKRDGEVVVTTNGCFDIIHVGHTRYLKYARSQGDLLVLAMNTDESIQRIKGPNRPLLKLEERMRIMAAFWMVDYVTWFDESDPCSVLSILKPDIHVKGGNYEMSQIIERDVVVKHGGKVVLSPLIPGNSTTHIIQRVIQLFS